MALLSPDTCGANNNLVYSSVPYLDIQGVGFAADSMDFNIYYDPGLSEYLLCDSTTNATCSPGDGNKVQFGSLRPIGSTPETGTVGLLMLGLAALTALMPHKRVSRSEAAV